MAFKARVYIEKLYFSKNDYLYKIKWLQNFVTLFFKF